MIDFDRELFDLMVKKAVEFWDMVQNDTPPLIMPDDDTTLAEVYKDHSGNLVEAQEFNERAAYLQELKMHRDEINKEIKEIETELKAKIADNEGVLTDKYKITWKKSVRTLFDKDSFQNEHRDLFEKYLLTSSYRTLRITNRKDVLNV